MKIKTKISYYEGYLPTKRHRKLRYRLIEEEVDLSVNKVSKKEAPVAFVVHKAIENEPTEYRLWNDKIWRPVLYNKKVAPFICTKKDDVMTLLSIYTYFSKSTSNEMRIYGKYYA